jgi:hypothetical protein
MLAAAMAKLKQAQQAGDISKGCTAGLPPLPRFNSCCTTSTATTSMHEVVF